MKKGLNKGLKVFGLTGGVFVLVFGNIKNFWRTVRLALNKGN
jgi:hypothetical protein